jgi:hypothetical protein
MAGDLRFTPGHPSWDECTVTDRATGLFVPISIAKLVGTIQNASVMMTSSSCRDRIRNLDDRIIPLAGMENSAIGEPNQ